MDRFDMCEKLVEVLGCEELLEELVCALSQMEAEDFFTFIAKNHDVELFENDEYED